LKVECSLVEWKEFLAAHPDAHVLQTGEWGELKSAFGWEAVRILSGDIGVQILFRKLPLGFSVAYVPKPVFSDRSSMSRSDDLSRLTGTVTEVATTKLSAKFWAEVDSVCRRHRAVFLKIEPDLWETESLFLLSSFFFHPSSFILSPHNIQPPRTIIIDIRGSEEEILARMKQKTRYNIRLAEKKGVTVRAWDDIPAFHKMMLATGGRDNFGVHSLEYYRRAYDLFHPTGMTELLVAEYEGKPLAALMVFARGHRAWYIYGASTDGERNRMPTYLLQWEAMRWARSKGAEEYDLWGVPDEDEATLEANFETRHDDLWGVYRFKRGFGGELKRSQQAVDRVYNPLLYKLYLRWLENKEL
jgi:peptidoglycan pentaglycine glycine transferase (the first glycine)